MKCIRMFTCLFTCLILTLPNMLAGSSSYLRIDVVEAVNMHCKLNKELNCNPYAVVEFKYSTETRTTKSIECTKNPKWESDFSFEPEYCKDIAYIYLYQYLTPKDQVEIGSAAIDYEEYDKGDVKPGYLGRITLELEKLPFGIIDDWFMVDTPMENSRILFPSCIHLRIQWTSTKCNEPSRTYQINSIKSNLPRKFEPTSFIPMCKKDFAMVYMTKFSRLDAEAGTKTADEIDTNKKNCVQDRNADYGFLHPYSNLTAVEEALVYRIIRRTTGENINYEEFVKDMSSHGKYIKSYKEFFEKECFKKPDLTIERINYILKNDAEDMPKNTTNPYLTEDLNKFDYSIKQAKERINNVYKDTLDQFYAVEDVKNLNSMDDETYISTLNKMVKVMKEMNAENKTDATIFAMKNKVMLTSQGLVNKKEEKFFRIYALYKWNGGHLEYDEAKREYMLRRKYFYCYEIIKMMPTNIIFQFIESSCPDNYVCIDPNGIVIKSFGSDPRKIFKNDIEKNGINFMHKSAVTNLRFKSRDSKNDEEDVDEDKMKLKNAIVNGGAEPDFELMLKMEEGITVNNSSEVAMNEPISIYTNKFDKLYAQRQIRIKKKKEIIINKVFNIIPILGEVLAVANMDKLDDNVDELFLTRETNLFKKYLLIYDASIPFVDKAARQLLDLVLCNTDKNRLRYLLREMLEGLCFGDDRSIKLFSEIVRTVIIDSLLKSPYFYFEDLHSKVNLVKTLNKPFCFKTITKVRFVETMLMMDIVKESITYIIWTNDTNKKIDLAINETEKSIPVTLKNNQRLFSRMPGRSFDNANEINKNFIANQNLINAGRFKSIESGVKVNNVTTLPQESPVSQGDSMIADAQRKLDEMKSMVTGITKSNSMMVKEDTEVTSLEESDLMKEFDGFFNEMHFKEKEKTSTTKKAEIKNEKVNTKPRFQDVDDNEFAKRSINQYNNPGIYEKHDEPGAAVLSTDQQLNQADIMSKIMKDPNTRKIIEETKQNPKNKILYPKEIQTTYEVNRKGIKQITVNKNSKIKINNRSNQKIDCWKTDE